MPPRWRTALWRGETAPIPIVRAPTRAVYPRRGPGDDAELAAVDQGASLALRFGTLLLAGGAPTEEVEAAIFAVGTAVGLGVFEVDITYGSIIISIAPHGDRPGFTDMRVVRGRSTHFARVAAAHQLLLELSEGRVRPEDVDARLTEIEQLRRPYPRWFVIVAFGALSAAITVQLGALSSDARSAQRQRLPDAGRCLPRRRGHRTRRQPHGPSTSSHVLRQPHTRVRVSHDRGRRHRAGVHLGRAIRVNTSLVIVGGIIALLPGMSLMVAAQEAIGSFAVTAAARIVELTFSTIGIVSGVLLGLIIADELESPDGGDVPPETNATTITTAVIAASIAAAAAAITYQAPARLAVVGGALAGLGHLRLRHRQLVRREPRRNDGSCGHRDRVRQPTPRRAAARAASPADGRRDHPTAPRSRRLLGSPRPEPERAGHQGIASLVEAATIAIALAAGVLLGQLIAGRLLHVPSLIPPRDLHRR